MTQADAPHTPNRRLRGFEAASNLLRDPIRKLGEGRGFAIARLLTHWAEVVGHDLGSITRPVKIGYGTGGVGATLTVLVSPAHAPEVQMQLPRMAERINAVYGYAAISRIHLTQTAATGFAEGRAEFAPAPRTATPAAPDPGIAHAARDVVAPVADAGLRGALETLARNVLSRRTS